MADWDDDQSTIHHQALSQAEGPLTSFVLRVESGPDRGKECVVDGGAEVVIGQSPICALQLTDPTVSRRHASFDVAGPRLRVKDLESRNGTFVGNVQVLEAYVGVDEVIRLGTTTISVRGAGVAAGAPPARMSFGAVVGASFPIRRLYPLFERISATTIPVLIEGETGTGKEVLARAIHDHGPRAKGPFVVFDCTATAASLIESELFGHEKGAFTGAQSTRRGVFEQANGGTLFIDELGDLPLELQSKLLRALEQSEVKRVGGEQWIKSDVRVIAATRRDLDHLISEGRFRDDLFHRLAVGRVVLPPLRERKGDVPLLVAHFCERLGVTADVIPRSVLSEWEAQPWAGNLRELRNAVVREVTLGELARAPMSSEEPPPPAPAGAKACDFGSILAEMLPFPQARQRVLDDFRDRYVEHMLAANHGNVQRAAQASGIALRYFHLLRARGKQ